MYNKKIIIVIPCFKVKKKILSVISNIPAYIYKIVCVDDGCPENSGNYIKENSKDYRLSVIFNQKNLGVGGASKAGFKHAKELGAEIIIKVDGDNQMDLSVLDKFIEPIISKEADFTKGNRFTKLTDYINMPPLRKIGNISLTFISRIVTGYYNLMDVTNGMIGLRVSKFSSINFALIKKDFFFEQDLIFHLSVKKFKFYHIKTPTIYEDEKSNLRPFRSIFPFAIFHLKNLIYRILS